MMFRRRLLIPFFFFILPFTNFYFGFFRKASSDFYHSLLKVTSSLFTLPPLLKNFIHFFLAGLLIAAMIFALCFWMKVKLKDLFFNSHSRYLTLFTFATLFSLIFSTFSREYIHYSLLLNFMLGTLGFHLVFIVYKNRLDLIRPTFYAVLVVAAIESIIGTGQFFMQHDLGLQFLSEKLLSPHMQNMATFWLPTHKEFFGGLLPWIPEGQKVILRAYGTFSHPNMFGSYLSISLFISYYVFLTSEKRWAERLLYALIPLQILTLVLTFSRGSLFSWIIASLVFFSIHFTKKMALSPQAKRKLLKLGACILVGSICVFALTYSNLVERGGVINRSELSIASDRGRILLFQLALLLFLHSPLIGVGYNGFGHVPYGTLSPEFVGANPMASNAHSIYLQTLSETGLIGLSLFLLFILSLYKPYLRIRFSLLSLTLGSIFLSLLLCGLVSHHLLTQILGRLIFFLFAGLFAACTYQERKATLPSPSSHSK
ncbi:MAG: hypothetical protein K1060chlam2_00160 [Chlamydiae bacterium]|nr:hypothetical protein [Chlamydiota bacterium]